MKAPKTDFPEENPGDNPEEKPQKQFRSLKELLDFASGRGLALNLEQLGDAGLAESLPFPFLAIVGQNEMKLALILGLINPNIGGVLLLGPRGTGKTTAVRSLLDIMPHVQRSKCYYGCLPEDIETGGMDAVCPDCAKKFGEGQSLTIEDKIRLVELPLNARLEDVVGGMDERAAIHERMRLHRGILAQADKNLLYIDEINLLPDEIVDAILDAAAQGTYTIRRGQLSATYRARFVLVGSMNPEEGRLRPQILDRFGLRVIVRGLESADDRMEAYQRVTTYLSNPHALINAYANDIHLVGLELGEARKLLPSVSLPSHLALQAIEIIKKMNIESLRAEITWFEAARAYAAADKRNEVTKTDMAMVAPMALRLRRSAFMQEFLNQQKNEEDELQELLQNL